MAPSVAESPETAVCDDAEAVWLGQQVDRLHGQDRDVLRLRTLGRSANDTASALGITYKAAEGSFTRARARMRAIWHATLGLTGLAGLRRLWTRAAVPVAVACFCVLFSIGMNPATPSRTDTRDNKMVSVTSTPDQHRASSPARLRPPGPRKASAPSTARKAVEREARPSEPAVVVRVAPIQVPDLLDTGGTDVIRTHPDESLPGTVRRCLSRGIHVSVHDVDCNSDLPQK